MPFLKLAIPFTLLVLAGVFVAWRSQKIADPEQNNSSNQPQELSVQMQESEQHAPDGTATLIQRTETKPGQPQTASFFVADIVDKEKAEERLIFTKTVAPGGEIVIHHNAWSPDNAYVALQETDQNGNLNFLVLKASGEPFADGEQYLDVAAIFQEKFPDYFMKDATGWASEIFFNVTTTDEAGAKGPSYWFDVTARNFWGHR